MMQLEDDVGDPDAYSLSCSSDHATKPFVWWFLTISCIFCIYFIGVNWEKSILNIATAILFPSTPLCDKDACCAHASFAVRSNGECELGDGMRKQKHVVHL